MAFIKKILGVILALKIFIAIENKMLSGNQ